MRCSARWTEQPYDPGAGQPGVASWTYTVRALIPHIRHLFIRHYELTMPSMIGDVPLMDQDVADILAQSPNGPGDVWMDQCTLLVEHRMGER